jgi:hypothetical protein
MESKYQDSFWPQGGAMLKRFASKPRKTPEKAPEKAGDDSAPPALLERQGSLASPIFARPLPKGHRALALFADFLEERYIRHAPLCEGSDSAQEWSAFCADSQALARLGGLSPEALLDWTSRVEELVSSASDQSWLTPMRSQWGVEVPLTVQTHAARTAGRDASPGSSLGLEGNEESAQSRNAGALRRAREAATKRIVPARPLPIVSL